MSDHIQLTEKPVPAEMSVEAVNLDDDQIKTPGPLCMESPDLTSLPLVRSAVQQDAENIKILADTMALSKITATEAQKSGFFVSGFSLLQYQDFIARYDHFFVVVLNGEIVAFLMAYNSEKIVKCEKEKINIHIRDSIAQSEYVLVKQICVSKKHRGKRLGCLLYQEICAKTTLQNRAWKESRNLYTVIVADPPNEPSTRFHQKVGYEKVADFMSPDGMPRHIYRLSLDSIRSTAVLDPSGFVYNTTAMIDENNVGVGLCVYDLKSPTENGTFEAHCRVVMKWYKPGIEGVYPKDVSVPRTTLNVDDDIRAPKFSLNEGSVDILAKYAYLDVLDPPDVITMHIVYRGAFKVKLNLDNFPMDVQDLFFRFRMWDSNPDDRCRNFFMLPFCDGTPITLAKKNDICSLDSEFQKPSVEIGVDEVCKTSFIVYKFRCVRSTPYYIRTVALPILFIASCVVASAQIDDFGSRVSNFITLLLTAVAFQFVAKDGLPKTKNPTALDMITAMSFLCIWASIMAAFLLETIEAPEKTSFYGPVILVALFLVFIIGSIVRMYMVYSSESMKFQKL